MFLLSRALAACLLFVPLLGFSISGPLNLRRACKTANDSDVVLKWNVPTDACSSFVAYDIYARKNNLQAFTKIDSVLTLSQNFYTHAGAFLLSNTWEYFIIIRFDCLGSPTLSSDTLSIDLLQTNDQYIDSVSVDPGTGKYIVGWKANTSKDIEGYRIYKVLGSNNIQLTDVDETVKSFIDFSSNPSVATTKYSIAAYDSCKNLTAIIDQHEPVKLTVAFDSCSHIFSLNWTAYFGFTISNYTVWANINSAGFAPLSAFSGSTFSYSFSNSSITDGSSICFLVRATKASDPSITSSSNSVCLTANYADEAQLNYINSVNVISKNQCEIKWITDNVSLIGKMLFQQSTDGVNFTTLNTLTPGSASLTFLANGVNTDSVAYYYRFIIYNTCGQPSDTSAVSNSILLKAKKIDPKENELAWNPYALFNAGIEKYEIYQGTGDIFAGYTLTLFATVSDGILKFNDTQLLPDIMNDGVCYYIKAIEKAGNAYGVSGATASSNMRCVDGELLVFFPNAFNPASKFEANKTFKPRGLYIDYAKSWLKVYDRWGELVFDGDLSSGWNGELPSKEPAPDGTYIYISSVYSVKGKVLNSKGIIHLER